MGITRFVLTLFIPCLIQMLVTSGQTQDITVVLNRVSNIEALLIEERLKTTSLQKQLSELKSRLDELAGAKHQMYDDKKLKGYVSEIMTKSLDIVQDGLLSEKHQRLRLENMAVEVKEIVMKQNAKENYKRIKQKTNEIENRIEVLERSLTRPPGPSNRPTRPPSSIRRPTRPPIPVTRPTRPPIPATRITRPPIPATRPTRPPIPATRPTRPPIPATRPTRPPIHRNILTRRTVAPHLLRANRFNLSPIQRPFGPKRNLISRRV